jgi:hypothetical protein
MTGLGSCFTINILDISFTHDDEAEKNSTHTGYINLTKK